MFSADSVLTLQTNVIFPAGFAFSSHSTPISFVFTTRGNDNYPIITEMEERNAFHT